VTLPKMVFLRSRWSQRSSVMKNCDPLLCGAFAFAHATMPLRAQRPQCTPQASFNLPCTLLACALNHATAISGLNAVALLQLAPQYSAPQCLPSSSLVANPAG
jgi:hypothetical protein